MEQLQQLTHEKLVKLYENDNNNKVLEILLLRYNENIFNYIFYWIRDFYLTKDIFQNTFFKVIVIIRQDKYTEFGKFRD